MLGTRAGKNILDLVNSGSFFIIFFLDQLSKDQLVKIVFIKSRRTLTELQQQNPGKTAPSLGTCNENVRLVQQTHLFKLHIFFYIFAVGKVSIFIWGADSATLP